MRSYFPRLAGNAEFECALEEVYRRLLEECPEELYEAVLGMALVLLQERFPEHTRTHRVSKYKRTQREARLERLHVLHFAAQSWKQHGKVDWTWVKAQEEARRHAIEQAIKQAEAIRNGLRPMMEGGGVPPDSRYFTDSLLQQAQEAKVRLSREQVHQLCRKVIESGKHCYKPVSRCEETQHPNERLPALTYTVVWHAHDRARRYVLEQVGLERCREEVERMDAYGHDVVVVLANNGDYVPLHRVVLEYLLRRQRST